MIHAWGMCACINISVTGQEDRHTWAYWPACNELIGPSTLVISQDHSTSSPHHSLPGNLPFMYAHDKRSTNMLAFVVPCTCSPVYLHVASIIMYVTVNTLYVYCYYTRNNRHQQIWHYMHLAVSAGITLCCLIILHKVPLSLLFRYMCIVIYHAHSNIEYNHAPSSQIT